MIWIFGAYLVISAALVYAISKAPYPWPGRKQGPPPEYNAVRRGGSQ